MNSKLILLLTEDNDLLRQSSKAAGEVGVDLIRVRGVNEAIQIFCIRDCKINLAIVDLDNGSHGITLLGAINMLREDLPIVAVTSTNVDYVAALAYANGAAACLAKPINATELEIVIRALSESQPQSKVGELLAK